MINGIPTPEILNVVFHSGANMLINHVTGSEISQLLGILNATQGKGTFMLINPNGIVVGPDAIINVGSLVLSSLNTTDAQLKSVLNVVDTRNGDVSTNLKWTKGGDIIIKNGAKLSVADTLELYGGRIQIADGVTISNGLQVTRDPSKNQVESIFVAADSVNQTIKGNGDHAENIVTAKNDNIVNIGKANFTNYGTRFHQEIVGGTVNLSGTKMGSKNNPVTGLGIWAFNKHENNFKITPFGSYIDGYTSKAGADNRVMIKDAEINVAPSQKGGATYYGGFNVNAGQVVIDNSKLSSSPLGISIKAYNNVIGGYDKSSPKIKVADMDTSNVVAIRNSEVAIDQGGINNAPSQLEILGGRVLIDKTTANVNNAGASIGAANQFSQKDEGDVSFKSDASNLIMIRGSKIAMMGDDNTATKGIEEGTAFIVGGQVKIDSSQAEVNNLEINAATNREDGKMFGGDDDRIFYATKDNALVIQDSTAKTTGHALFTGGSVSLLGKNVANVGEGKSFIVAAGDKVGLKFVEEKEHLKRGEIFGDNLVMANGTVKVSKETTANQENQISKDPEIYKNKWLEGFYIDVEPSEGDSERFAKDKSFVELDKFFASLKEIATPAQSAVVEKLGNIFYDSTLSNAKKVEKLNEVISQDKEVSALMVVVRGQVDNATTATPQTSTAIPAATSIESTNVAAGEGVMSSDESAVKGVDKKKK